jgi:hypothetical protein
MGSLWSSATEPLFRIMLFRIIKGGEIELDAEVPEFYMAKLRAVSAPASRSKVWASERTRLHEGRPFVFFGA